MTRGNILISAYAFSPYQGSECAVGWNIVTRLAKIHDVTVLCGDLSRDQRMKADLDRYFSENPPIAGLHIHYVKPNFLIQVFEKIHTLPGFWMSYYWAYNLWQRKAFQNARKLHAECPFDLIHQLNMIGFREPGYLWQLRIPFVWGPIGGAADIPVAFFSMFSRIGRGRVIVRNVVNAIQKWILWRPRYAAYCAVKLWAVTSADIHMVKKIWGVEVEQMLEAGTAPGEKINARLWNGRERLRIVWSGIHLPRKALPILFHAISSKDLKERVVIDVLGEGAETTMWKALAEQLGLNDVVTWHGMLVRDKALAVMSVAHVLAVPSLSEASSTVVLEALSLGLPVICHDACGMGVVITEKCGFKVPLCDPKISIEGFAQAIRRILEDRTLVESLSRGALERAVELSWDKKAADIASEYEKIIVQGRFK